MTETRIRWSEDAALRVWSGYVGALGEQLFTIAAPLPNSDKGYLLMSRLPGMDFSCSRPKLEKAQAEAERWLAEFVTSLGASFEPEPVKSRPSRAWHADWAEVDRDQDGNAILKHKPDGGLYRLLPVEEN